MSLTLISPPAVAPVGLAKLQAHLRVEPGEDDDFLQHCLDTAIAQFDGPNGELGQALINQTWQETFDSVPTSGGAVELFLLPVSSVSKVEVFGSDAVWAEMDPNLVTVYEQGGWFHLSADQWPRAGKHRHPLRVEYVAGFGPGAANVPAPIGHAILLFAAHLYEVRVPVVIGGSPVEVPISIDRLLAPFKVWWR